MPQQTVRRPVKPVAKPRTVTPPLLEARDDPFALFPGMQKPDTSDASMGPGTEPQMLEVFRGEPPPITVSESNRGGEGPPTPEPLPPLPLPTLSVAPLRATASTGFKLTGIVRYHGKAMAVVQLQDKTTVHTAEGERIAGTDCQVQTIMPTKILVKRKVGGQQEQDWLFMGEEWRT